MYVVDEYFVFVALVFFLMAILFSLVAAFICIRVAASTVVKLGRSIFATVRGSNDEQCLSIQCPQAPVHSS